MVRQQSVFYFFAYQNSNVGEAATAVLVARVPAQRIQA